VIRDVVQVDFARPRDEGLKRTPPFLEIVDHIWRLIGKG
jgi:hypothetical protein